MPIVNLFREGRVLVPDKAAEEAKLKRNMRCPLTGQLLKNMPAVKAHVASQAYRNAGR